MPTILIVEGNTAEFMRETGSAGGAMPFVREIHAIAPEFSFKLVYPYESPLKSDDLQGISGAIFTGAGVNWSTDAPEAQPLRDAMITVFDAGIPTWGSCNGLQLAATVLGGTVGASPNGLEVGMARNLTPTRAAETHPMMAGRTAPYAVPCVHRDEVQTLPDGSVLMAGNAHSPIQAFAYEQNGIRFWGTQYHPELRAADIAGFFAARDGIFADEADMAPDLAIAEQDPAAAARIGTSPDELATNNRTRELSNWVKSL